MRGSDNAIRLAYSMKPSAPYWVRRDASDEIIFALAYCRGDVKATAKRLDMGRATLNRLIAGYPKLQRALAKARRETR